MKRTALFAQRFYPNASKRKIDSLNEVNVIGKNNRILMEAHNAWNGLDKFRKEAARNEKFAFGDQWSDRILVDGKWITEKEHISNQGNVPLQNNRIRGTLRTVVSLFAVNKSEPVCVVRDSDEQSVADVMSTCIQYVHQINKMPDIDSLNLMYMLNSAFVGYYSQYGSVGESRMMDISTRIVNYNNVFFDNDMEDPRHWDCHLIGEIHDMGLYDVMAKFAKSRAEAEKIREIYSIVDSSVKINYYNSIMDDKQYNKSFFMPVDNARCRVIEVWKTESKERLRVHDRLSGDLFKMEIEDEWYVKKENERRIAEQSSMGVTPENYRLLESSWFVDNYWYFWYLSPYGDVLSEGETPYLHKSHPYSFKITPFYNGRAYPFVSDFIPQQKILNRYIITQDFINRHAAKGVLMFPEESKPDSMSMDEIADAWTSYDGIIYYKAKGLTQAPQQIITNSQNAGLSDMINLQLKMFEDISGVQGAIQGQAPNAGTPASLFAQQVQNAATSLTEVFNSFRYVREDLNNKLIKLIQQFYDSPRYINLAGSDGQRVYVDPAKIQNAEIDLSLTETPATPAYRMVVNDMLSQLQANGQITLEEMLQAGSYPYKDKLLSLLAKRREQGQQINANELMQQAQQ